MYSYTDTDTVGKSHTRIWLYGVSRHAVFPYVRFWPTLKIPSFTAYTYSLVCLKFRGSGPEKNWSPPPKPRPHQRTTPPQPPPQFDPYINQSIALDVRIPNMEFLVDLTRAVQMLCFLTPPVHKTCLLFTKSTRHASCSQSPQGMPPVHKVHKTCLPFTKSTRHASRSRSSQDMPPVHKVHKACLPFTQSTRHACRSHSPQDMPPVHKIYKACLLFTKSTRHASCSQNPQDMPPVHKARN